MPACVNFIVRVGSSTFPLRITLEAAFSGQTYSAIPSVIHIAQDDMLRAADRNTCVLRRLRELNAPSI